MGLSDAGRVAAADDTDDVPRFVGGGDGLCNGLREAVLIDAVEETPGCC